MFPIDWSPGTTSRQKISPGHPRDIERYNGFDMFMRHAKRVVIVVVGGTLLLVGVALLVLPGPAFVVIPVALAILATEFAWAKHLLKKARDVVSAAASRVNTTRHTEDMADTADAADTQREPTKDPANKDSHHSSAGYDRTTSQESTS